MFNSASYKGRLLVALFCLIGWAGLLATAPASAQFKAWVMAKLPEIVDPANPIGDECH
jgi:hypothetical protein